MPSFVFLSLIFLFSSLPFAWAQSEQATEENYDPEKLVLTSAQLFESDGKHILAINFQNQEHWHTYWKNPGDAGDPISTVFTVGEKKMALTELEWPAPKRYLDQGDMLAFGYEGNYSLFYQLDEGQLETIKKEGIGVQIRWLVCKHLCIPGQKSIKAKWEGESLSSPDNQFSALSQSELESRLAELPQAGPWPQELDIYLQASNEENRLWLLYELKNLKQNLAVHPSGLLLPFPNPHYSSKGEELVLGADKLIFGRMKLHWEGQYLEPAIAIPQNGKFNPALTMNFLYFAPGSNRAIKISTTLEQFSTLAWDEKSWTGLAPVQQTQTTNARSDENQSIWTFLLLAFLGGLLLNVMPCVLPVISLKLFGLVSHAHDNRKRLIAHNLAYTAGIIVSFLALAATIVVLKSIGTQVGWGLQMQSPSFIGVMIVVIFILTFNLFGLFEFSTPGGRKLGGVKLENSFAGDFLGGVLATILATPCSAPFLGTALTFAFTSGPVIITLVFLMIGFGLSFPFLLTALFPASIRWIPRPGHWMNHLKAFLGLTLLLTNAWLFDVFFALGPSSMAFNWLWITLIFFFFGLYFRAHIGKRKIFRTLFIIIPFIFLLFFLKETSQTNILNPSATSSMATEHSTDLVQWQNWSEDKLSKNKGQWVLINFTAKWCFTCKVNERLVFDTQDFAHFVKANNLQLLLGDWTKRDPAITSFLEKNKRFGVPSYFMQSPSGELFNLGETISIGKIKDQIEKINNL